jgi:hypothetical protein
MAYSIKAARHSSLRTALYEEELIITENVGTLTKAVHPLVYSNAFLADIK